MVQQTLPIQKEETATRTILKLDYEKVLKIWNKTRKYVPVYIEIEVPIENRY